MAIKDCSGSSSAVSGYEILRSPLGALPLLHGSNVFFRSSVMVLFVLFGTIMCLYVLQVNYEIQALYSIVDCFRKGVKLAGSDKFVILSWSSM